MKKRFISGIVLVLVLILVVFNLFFSESEIDEGKIKEKLISKIQITYQQTHEKNNEVYLKTISESDTLLNKSFKRAFENINIVLDELVSVTGCMQLFYYSIKDQWKGTAEVDSLIQAVIEKYITNEIAIGMQGTVTSLTQFEAALSENRTDMIEKIRKDAKSVLRIHEFIESNSSFDDFRKELNYIGRAFPEISSATIEASFNLVISALIVKSTMHQVKVIFRKAIIRFGKTKALSLLAAAGDGPLVIGDIIALVISIGGTAWSAYELYQAQVVLKEKVALELRSAIEQYQRKVVLKRDEISKKLLEEYERSNNDNIEILLKFI